MSAAGNVNIVLSVNQATYSAAMKDAQKQLDVLAQKSTAVGHATVSSMQASSAALRVFEGGMNNSLRAGERFLSMIPGVGAALQAAFPVVGAIAFGAIIAKVGKEFDEFIKKARRLPDEIGRDFNAMTLAGRTANDELARTDAELQNHIALLENKPQNYVAEALIDARIAADKLAGSLQAAEGKMEELFTKDHVSYVSGIFAHTAPTAGTESSINDWNQAISELALERSAALQPGGAGQTRAAELLKELDAKRQQALAWAAEQQEAMRALQTQSGPAFTGSWFKAPLEQGVDEKANLKELTGFRSQLYDQQTQEQLESQVAQDGARDKAAQSAKDFAAKQKALQAEEVQGWHQQLEDLKASQDTTLLQEAQFWLDRATTVQQGSLAYRAAMDAANKIVASMRQQSFKASQEFDALGGGTAADHPNDTPAQNDERMKADAYLRSTGNMVDDRAQQEKGKQAVEYIQNLDKGIALEKSNSSALAEDSIAMAVATGQMTQLDAARARAALHTQEYSDALEQLDRAQAKIESNPALTPLEQQDQLSALGNQRSQVTGQRSVQVLQDQQTISSQTVASATTEALGQMVDAWKDMADSIKGTLMQSINGANEDIVKLLTQKQIYPGDVRRAFGGTVEQGAQGLLRTGLQKGESAILGGFGIGGKRDGSTAQQALWVQMAGVGLPRSTAGAGVPGISSTFSQSPVGRFVNRVFGGHGSSASGGTVPSQDYGPESDVARVLRSAPTLLRRPSQGAAPSDSSSDGSDSGDLYPPWQGIPYALPLAPALAPLQASALPNFMSFMPGMDQNQLPPGADSEGNANSSVTTILHPAPSQAGSFVSKLTSMVLSSYLGSNRSSQGGSLGGDDSGGDDSGGDITSLTPGGSDGSESMFQGFFAAGGDVLANRPAIVGEQGPEVFMPASAGRIIPNHQLGGTSTTHQISIDARGSNDPAQTEAAINRAMRNYLPQAVSASVAKTRDNQKRGPGTSR